MSIFQTLPQRSMKKVWGRFSLFVLMPVERAMRSWGRRRCQQPFSNCCRRSCRNRYDGDREVEDRTFLKPEVPFMVGSVENMGRETSHTANTHCYLQATGSP